MEEKKGIVVKVDHVTKDYGKGRGNFDMSFNVHKGEAFGLVGENGAGKTTIIRQIMGFIKPTSGNILVYGLNAYKEAARIKSYVGYVPGEINFPDYRTGIEFLHAYANMVGVTDFTYSDTIIKRLQLDIRAYPRRMSKGMKQKTAIVTALMMQAPLIIMDEPTTGLDPLMRDEFLKIVLEEKERGATIIMSSNTVEELERVCDKVALVSQGRIVDIADVNAIRNRSFRDYKIEFNTQEDYDSFVASRGDIKKLKPQQLQAIIRIEKKDEEELMRQLSNKKVKFMTEINYNLNTYFEERR